MCKNILQLKGKLPLLCIIKIMHTHIFKIHNNNVDKYKNFALSRKCIIFDLYKSRMNIRVTGITAGILIKVNVTSMLIDGDMKDMW